MMRPTGLLTREEQMMDAPQIKYWIMLMHRGLMEDTIVVFTSG